MKKESINTGTDTREISLEEMSLITGGVQSKTQKGSVSVYFCPKCGAPPSSAKAGSAVTCSKCGTRYTIQ